MAHRPQGHRSEGEAMPADFYDAFYARSEREQQRARSENEKQRARSERAELEQQIADLKRFIQKLQGSIKSERVTAAARIDFMLKLESCLQWIFPDTVDLQLRGDGVESKWVLHRVINGKDKYLTNSAFHKLLHNVLHAGEGDADFVNADFINDALRRCYDRLGVEMNVPVELTGIDRRIALITGLITARYFKAVVREDWWSLVPHARTAVRAILRNEMQNGKFDRPLYPPFWYLQMFQVESTVSPLDVKFIVYGIDPSVSPKDQEKPDVRVRATGLAFHLPAWVKAKGNSHWSDRDVGAEPLLLSQLREYGFDVDEGRRVAGDGPRSLLSKGVVFVNAIRTIPSGDRTNSSGDKINEHDAAWEEHVVPLCLPTCSESGWEYTSTFHSLVEMQRGLKQAVLFRSIATFDRSGDRCGDPKTVKALLSKSTKLEQLRHPSRLGEHDDKPSQKECQAFFSRFVEHIRAL